MATVAILAKVTSPTASLFDGVATRLAALLFTAGLSQVLGGRGLGLGSLRPSHWGPWRQCGSPGQPSPQYGGPSSGVGGAGGRHEGYCDPGHSVGAGLSSGKAQVASGQRIRPQPLVGPRSLAGSKRKLPAFTSYLSESPTTRSEDEVLGRVRPVGRDRVRGGDGTAKAVMATELRLAHGGIATRERGAEHGTDFSDAKKNPARHVPLRRFCAVCALRQEGDEGAQVQNVSTSSGRWIHDAGGAGTEQLHSVASELPGLQDYSPHARRGDDGYVGLLRGAHREAYEALPWSLAPHRGGRRPWTLGAPQPLEGYHAPAHQCPQKEGQ